MEYELVPKGQHRRNIAKKAIQTWKSHAIGVLCGLPPSFPLFQWDELLPQIDMQVNLLRFSNIAPKVCSWTVLNGQHDFNRHPLAPLGIEIQMLDHPDKQKTWGTKSHPGHYLATSLHHYRYYFGWFSDTNAKRGSESVVFKHKYITSPTVTPADAIVQAAKNLANALKGKIPPPLAKSGIDQLRALTGIFNATNEQNPESPPDSVAPPPRVEAQPATSPRVQIAQTQNDPFAIIEEPTIPELIVASPTRKIVASPIGTSTSLPACIPNYVSQSQSDPDDAPAHRTRSRSQVVNVMEEALLSCVQLSPHSIITPRTAARRKYPLQLLCELAGAVLDAETGDLLEYRHLIRHPQYKEVWGKAFGKEIGRLAQGLPGVVDGTDTLDFITKNEVPRDRFKDCTYARIVCNERPEKSDPNRCRITVGGDKINYPGDCGTPTAALLTVKLLLNSVISTKGAKFMTLDIANFYLMTPLKRKEYVRMRMSDFPPDVVDHYKLKDKVTPDGFVYVAIKRGMYGLPQSGILAQELLEKRLNNQGYHQSKHTPGLWTHDWRPISFSLVVDDFGVKYVGEEHANHLVNAIKEHYDVTEDWEGKRYLGLTFDWDYTERKVHLSMPDYIPDALTRFNRERPKRKQNQPHAHTPPNYGAKQQFAKPDDTEPLLDAAGKKYVQQVLGTFLYYARAVDSTMLVALSAIASEQAAPTQTTMRKVDQFLDYVASQEEAVLTYEASNMVLAVHSDASYLSEPKARSRAGGHFFLSDNSIFPANNGAVLNIAQIIRNVMSSAAEAEIGAMYINARETVPMRRTLEEMGHPQPRTPLQTDNTAAHSVVTNNVQPRRTKAMDMRFYWLRDRAAQDQFRYYWRPGSKNLADYWTKHHPGTHHENMRAEFLTPKWYLEELRRKRATSRRTVELAQVIMNNRSATRVC
jgi:hypothetical protein